MTTSTGSAPVVTLCAEGITAADVLAVARRGARVELDPAAREQVASVLISTHMLEMVEELWEIMFVMEKGHIVGSYTKSDAEGKDLDELFFAMTGGDKQ